MLGGELRPRTVSRSIRMMGMRFDLFSLFSDGLWFSVTAARAIEVLAAKNDVRTHLGSIMYRITEVEEKIVDLLPVLTEMKVTGTSCKYLIFE